MARRTHTHTGTRAHTSAHTSAHTHSLSLFGSFNRSPSLNRSLSRTLSGRERRPPPDLIEIGQHSWTLLHSLGAYYPEHPSERRKQQMRDFLTLFAQVFPCGSCATHFRQLMIEHPPAVDSRQDLSLWMCNAHNSVNQRLGKPLFDCNRIQERWDAVWFAGAVPCFFLFFFFRFSFHVVSSSTFCFPTERFGPPHDPR